MAFHDEIKEFIIDHCRGSELIEHYQVPGGGEVDLFVPDKNLAIALYSVNNSAAANIERRTLLGTEGETPIIHLWEDQWLQKAQIIQSRLKSHLGLSQKIHGRETRVMPVDTGTMLNFLEENHLQVPLKAKYRFGLYHMNVLVAIATFSGCRPMVRKGVPFNSYELLRFCNKNGITVVGGLGKLLTHFIEAVKPDDIMTYRDMDWPGGKAFNALGFEQTGQLPPIEFWLDTNTGIRHYPHRIIEKNPGLFAHVDTSALSDESLRRMGFVRVFNGGSEKLLKRIKAD